ncbi:MAG: phosphate/phosphite/phosphonate ABC transporter substrate-binding protein [Nitrospirae bacterium]|nr:phosphate/phosphite/phosphonate ABC transporter substrate-binding protein [Nitrospirota bacterium]
MPLLKRYILLLLVLSIAAPASASPEEEITFAISPMASPVSTLSSFSDFIAYLSKKTGKKVVLKQRRKYSDINSLLKSGEAQFAYTCTGAYLSGRNEFGLEVLAVPVINGKTTYNSYLIVNKESDIKDFRQLKGKVFAFTDPMSLSGRIYPAYLLETMNTTPEKFFRKTFYTSSHEKSVESVAYGLADGAAVDSLIFEDMKRMKVPATAMVNIIQISPPYGIPPIVVSPGTDKSIKQIMLSSLLKMKDDPSGKEILKQLQIEKFVLPDPAIYHSAVQMRQAAMLP